MGPNQDNQNVEPVSGSDIVFRNGPKSNKGMIAGMVCLALLAIGGISFGVWAMMDGNAKVEQLSAQIDALKQQNSELQEKIVEVEKNETTAKCRSGGVGYDTEVVEGVFYVKNAYGEIVAQSTVSNISDIVACDFFSEANNIKCAVTSSEGEGWFLYDYKNNILTSSFDAE